MKTLTSITFLFVTLTIFGCGGGGTVITGSVKYTDGTPVTLGQVVFDNGVKSYFGQIRADGTYSSGGNKAVEGIPDGSYKIWLSGTIDGSAEGNDPDYSGRLTIAKKYISPATTDLTFEVKSGGTKVFDITVEKP
jgi:hypothetical protein